MVEASVGSGLFRKTYADVFHGDELWRELPVPPGERFAWEPASTYVRKPPYFDGMPREAPSQVEEIARRARARLARRQRHHRPHLAGRQHRQGDRRRSCTCSSRVSTRQDFNSYGSRRGNHEVMVRGTFANVRLRNRLAPGTEGGVTVHVPSGEPLSIFDASVRYRGEGVPLLILAGKEYGSGSSRDWAAKGPALLGVRAVIAESYERIHRSNLVGMGVLPLEFEAGASAASLGLSGRERFDVLGLRDAIASGFASGRTLIVRASGDDGKTTEFRVRVRIDTPTEIEYYRHGGILLYVLRSLLG